MFLGTDDKNIQLGCYPQGSLLGRDVNADPLVCVRFPASVQPLSNFSSRSSLPWITKHPDSRRDLDMTKLQGHVESSADNEEDKSTATSALGPTGKYENAVYQ